MEENIISSSINLYEAPLNTDITWRQNTVKEPAIKSNIVVDKSVLTKEICADVQLNVNETKPNQTPEQCLPALEEVQTTSLLSEMVSDAPELQSPDNIDTHISVSDVEVSAPTNNGESNGNLAENGLEHCSEDVSKDEYIILDENTIIMQDCIPPETHSPAPGLSVEDNVALLLSDSKSYELLPETENNHETVETYVVLPATGQQTLLQLDQQTGCSQDDLTELDVIDELAVREIEQSKNDMNNTSKVDHPDKGHEFITTKSEEMEQKLNSKVKISAPKRQTVLLNKTLNDSSETLNPLNSNSENSTAVMNDSQLLAILEGDNVNHVKDDVESNTEPKGTPAPRKSKIKKTFNMDPEQEKLLALQQLKELPSGRRKATPKKPKISDVKIPRQVKIHSLNAKKENEKKDNELPHENCDPLRTPTAVKTYSKKVNDDISMLIADWIEDEAKGEAVQLDVDPEIINTPQDKLPESDKSLSKTSDSIETESGPRRISRIIKKKIIYDPDNPATFKYAATSIAKKDVVPKETVPKVDIDQELKSTPTPPKSKVAKKKAKKPTPPTSPDVSAIHDEIVQTSPEINSAKRKSEKGVLTNSGKKKKKTEVDKLLDDEGAVNMIYQVERSNNNSEVPEIALKPNKKSMISLSKERKSLMSKTKIIKRAVISLCKSNDNKQTFRARREGKTLKTEQVSVAASLRNSMQSPSLSELSNVAGYVADESRIIRRHSSSSFSSGCLSPRPQSPTGDSVNMIDNEDGKSLPIPNTSSTLTSSTPIVPPTKKHKGRIPASMKRIKGQLLAKSQKEKEVISTEAAKLNTNDYTQLSIDVQNNVTHIIIKPTGNSQELYDLQVLRELRCAVEGAGASGGAVLLTSGEGALCGGLDVRCVLQTTPHQQRINANRLTEAFKELVVSLCSCPCPIVMGVGGACAGPGVALLSLADLALASDRASFCAAPRQRRRLPPEGACLLARPQALPPQLSRELLLCGRKLTASEALQRGLVARTLWPDCFTEELKSITEDLANHPVQSLGVIKNVLRRGDVPSAVTALRHESRLLTEFWCTPEGQEAVKETHKHL